MTSLAEKRAAREARSVALPTPNAADIATMVETVLIKGDLSKLTPQQRDAYYLKLCEVTGLNPLMQPFDYLTLQGKTVLYAKKEAAAQLRSIHGISVVDMDQDEREGIYTVTVKVQNAQGRMDMDIGSVNVANKKGDDRANAMLKAATKAKRRATLSICGLGLLDETEVETIPGARIAPDASASPAAGETPTRQPQKVVNPDTGRMIDPSSPNQQRKNSVWERFERTIRAIRDVDELEEWWADADTQAAIEQQPAHWQREATEEYEKRKEALLNAGRP